MNLKRRVLLDFLRSYRKSPSLWNREHVVYNDRRKKAKDYQILIKILKQIEPNATRKTVVKKINSFRSNFRKELRNVKNVEASEYFGDSPYKPSLWYYNELLFLIGEKNPDESLSIADSIEYKVDVDVMNEKEFMEEQNSIHGSENDEDGWTSSTEGEDLDTQLVPKRTQKRKRKFTSHSDEDYSSNHYMKEDEYLIMAKNYAIKLKKMEPLQRLFADRLINEVLLEGQLGTLSKQSVVCVDPPVATT